MDERKKTRDWESWLDQQIRDAQERGEFDDLPGKGKPIDLTPNPYAQDRELAFKILKDAGYAPEWIEMGKAIRGKLEKAQETLARRQAWYQAQLDGLSGRSGSWAEAERERAAAGRQRAKADFEEEVAAINAEIAELNLKVPNSRFQRPKVDAALEIERVTAGQA